MTLTNPIPSVEWMPLDGLIQSWAIFAHGTTQEHGLILVRSAFDALSQESAARRLYFDHRTPTTEVLPSLAFLAEAASSWLTVLDSLHHYCQHTLPLEEEQSEQMVAELVAISYQHLLSVASLSVRLLHEYATSLAEPVRVLIGTLAVPEPEVRL